MEKKKNMKKGRGKRQKKIVCVERKKTGDKEKGLPIN